MTYRILSLDGGNGDKAGVFMSTLERRAEALGWSFVRNVDLFAGTANGAINALLLAWFDDPVHAFEAILRFDDEAREGQTPWSMAGTMLGNNAAHSPKNILKFCDEIFGPGATLMQVKRPVILTTVRLDDEVAVENRTWRPQYFTNLPSDAGRVELIADVAARAMAMPLQYPLYQSRSKTGPAYVDGAVAANNPAMIALASALAENKAVGDLSLLSIGSPRNLAGKTRYLSPQLSDGMADWGYRQWMLDPSNPLVLVDLMLQAGSEAVNMQCRQLLGDRFRRIDPPVFTGPAWDAPDGTLALDLAMDWLEAHGWKPKPPVVKVQAASSPVLPV